MGHTSPIMMVAAESPRLRRHRPRDCGPYKRCGQVGAKDVDVTLIYKLVFNGRYIPVYSSGVMSTVRLWETGVANLERSLAEWRKMVGGDDDLTMIDEKNILM